MALGYVTLGYVLQDLHEKTRLEGRQTPHEVVTFTKSLSVLTSSLTTLVLTWSFDSSEMLVRLRICDGTVFPDAMAARQSSTVSS